MFLVRNSRNINCNYRKPYVYCFCLESIRLKSSAEPKIKTYSHTILSLKTNFPARSNIAKKEEIQKAAQFSELYNWQREHLSGPEYVLHDGPPYANGDLHMGHAVNKIIKDINNRSQVLQGNKVHYIPGWDCHGLPIELKALQKAKKKHKNAPTDPVNIRKIAREFALDTVESQKAAFESWGVMADWEKQYYLTLNNGYVKNQLHQFLKMYKDGYIFRTLKPVYWSPSSRTALAEAELEYDLQYKSTEVYVKFPLEVLPDVVNNVAKGKQVSAIIWTTTPWTLVFNRAICYNPLMKYSVVKLSTYPDELYVVASGLVDSLKSTLDVDVERLLEFDGQLLTGTKYYNKLVKESLPFLEGEHVKDDKGTGLVHTAPAHGPEDFLVALKNNMAVVCNVDEAGFYTNLDDELNGLPVLSKGQEVIISRLSDSILSRGTYTHSYPLDWRTKKPIIIRASQQWFIDTERLKEKAQAALEKVEILPPSSAEQSRQGFRAQLEKRPYWCISRQRAWGVPIPALYCGDDVIVHEGIIDNLCALVDKEGPDSWWTCDVKHFLPEEVLKEYDLGGKVVTKGQDIMDIWFDSGISWSTLYPGGYSNKAHLYSEGHDQLTGWFQTSLLTSVALTGDAPYRSIFVHGFAVDDKKRKMSKSIGNVIDPATVIHGGKDRNSQPAYGIDTLRWWVASHGTQHSQIVISKKLLDDCQSEVIRIRNILKYLLGVVGSMEKTDFEKTPQLNYFDQYIVQETHDFVKQIKDNYNNFRYNHVAQSILFFISNKVSSLYCHCVKDRLYCSEKYSNGRISAQMACHTIFVSLCKALGPILPHLVEEAWQHHPLFEKPFYFSNEFETLPPNPVDSSIMDAILEIKRDICVSAKNENLKKFKANIKLGLDLYNKLIELNSKDDVSDTVLCEILELSDVNLEVINGGKKWLIELSESNKDQCLRCRKYNAMENSDKCMRCEKVLNAL
ncbi:isoleucine--tRNA ligase, mitochondrial [Plodia interpunctella]|uniref:isoleucine--tRNA ligase, mitochondrial n=1 Tax=Plodia interpunctella TaxID=58824 RepID=UPI002368B7DC|nr:isoleucine--tRNA ligase, mitochondrial [Plodia interpunctella]